MAGLGKTTFVAGTILTASQVNGYLMDQVTQVYAGTAARGSALPVPDEGMMTYLADTNSVQMATGTATFVNVDSLPRVAGTATRDALYPSPTAGNTVFRTDTGVAESYYAAYSTAVPGGRDAAGWYGTTRVDGLVPIQPTSVTVAPGTATATATALGVITFANITSLKLNNVFSASFLNYKVLIDITTGSTTDSAGLQLKMDGAGATSYFSQYLRQYGTTVDGLVYASTNLWNLGIAGRSGAAGASVDLSIYKPFVAANTKFNAHNGGNSTAAGEQQQILTRGRLNDTSSYTGMEILPSAGNVSGTIQVFGYNS